MDKKIIDTHLASIVQAVAESDAAMFNANVRSLEFDELPQAWQLIANAHTQGKLNLTLVLDQWLHTAPESAFELMGAMDWVTQPAEGDALRFLVFAAGVPESYRHSAAILLAPALKASPRLACELLETISGSVSVDISALFSWSIAYTKANPLDSLELALASNGPNSAVVLSLVLQCVDMTLPLVTKAVMKRESTVVARLHSISTVPIQTLAPWWVLARMSCFSPIATKTLLDAISEGVAPATVGLASSLSTMPVPGFGTPPVPTGTVLEMLLYEAARLVDAQYAVDGAIVSMLRRPSTQQAVVDILSLLGSSEDEFEVYLQRTFRILVQKGGWSTPILTAWLVTPQANVRRIRNLITSLIGHAPTLDAAVLSGAPAEMRISAARRLLALTHDGETLCRFVRVFAEEPSLQPEGVETAGEMLNYALAEYPAATRIFLQNRVKECGKHEEYSAMYRTVYCNALVWQRVLKNLPSMKELQPSLSQSQALWAMRRRHNRDVMRGAQEKSIFASISKQSHIVQGRRVAIRGAGEAEQMFPLQELSHSIELPTSELADPVGGSLRRAKYLRDAK